MRKVLIWVGIGVVALVVLALVIPPLMNVNRYHDRIVAELEASLNRKVSLGKMRLSLFPPEFVVQDAKIGEDKTFATGRPFAQAQELKVRVELMPLLRGNVVIDSLQLKQPQIELVKNAGGTWNFTSLGTQAGNQTKGAAPTKGQKQGFTLGEVAITDGQVAVTDLQQHQPRAVYDHIDLTLTNFAAGQPFTLKVAAHLPGQGNQLAELDGKGGPVDDANPANTPFDGTLKLNEVSLAGAQQFLNSSALQGTDATITGTASVKNRGGKLASTGELKLANTKVHGVALGYPVTLDYNLVDDLQNDLITISQGKLMLGTTPMSVSGTIQTRSTPAVADLQLTANDVSVAEVAKLGQAFGVAMQPGTQVAGKMTANIHAQGAVTSPALDGTVAMSDLTMDGQPLASKANAKFSSTASGENFIKTLNGKMSVNMLDGRLANVNLMKELGSIGQFQSLGKTADAFTKIIQMTGDLNVTNGVASTNNLLATIDGGTLAGVGTLNLADNSVNMRVTAVLTKALSQQVGGTSIGGLMQTALANQNGELVLPVLVSGTLDHMRFAPDVAAIAQMRMKNMLPSLTNPGASTSGLLNSLLGKQGPATGTTTQQPNTKPTVKGLMDSLFGGKKKTK